MVKMKEIVLPAGRKKRIHGVPRAYQSNVADQTDRVPSFAIEYNGKTYPANQYEIIGGEARPLRTKSSFGNPMESLVYNGFICPITGKPKTEYATAATWAETTGKVVIRVNEKFSEPLPA